MEELKATYNNRVVYGLADSSNVYIDTVSLKKVLDCSIYSELMKSDRLWVSADDLAVILEDNNCPTDDFEKWLASIRNIDYKPKTHAITYSNDKKIYYSYKEGELVFSLNSIIATHYNSSNIVFTNWRNGNKYEYKPNDSRVWWVPVDEALELAHTISSTLGAWLEGFISVMDT
ncbi:hypothetical protein AVV41_gp010 [Microcystis phage MaMV-DC]|uniref:Uncharacterized protein n=1 Tax=Microcystis phage MaMV-DC TaxID=1357715 RepID=A0A075BUP4_9CAUD|nr:hypothetical protein AVV41_gp010 [Microcystis phage MaMV-DC]AGR48575.1 hypothetical protein MaMVDC_10 [Microcystis phage MaMV-DC]